MIRINNFKNEKINITTYTKKKKRNGNFIIVTFKSI